MRQLHARARATSKILTSFRSYQAHFGGKAGRHGVGNGGRAGSDTSRRWKHWSWVVADRVDVDGGPHTFIWGDDEADECLKGLKRNAYI